MANRKSKTSLSEKDVLPKIILIASENSHIDAKKKADEIRYYLTQIILLADKRGRPAKNQIPEVDNAA